MKSTISIILTTATIAFSTACQSQNKSDRTVTVHLRGVPAANIALVPLTGTQAHKPLKVAEQIKHGQSTVFTIEKSLLPADFQVRFEYRDMQSGQPTGAEKRVFVRDQNVELYINPMFATNPDSVRFLPSDKENIVYQQFMEQNQKYRENISMLQMVLTKYDDPRSEFYREGIKEYKSKIKQHAEWIQQQISTHRKLFVSSTFALQVIPELDFTLDEKSRKAKMLENYIQAVDFTDTLMSLTSDYRKWLDNYVNQHFERSYTAQQVDSALTQAGIKLIEKAKTGHPTIYGKMVDYFFEGYESMGMQGGIKMLAPYVADPKCMASKKSMILRRLDGLGNLFVGAKAPDFIIKDSKGNPVQFHTFGESKPYKLLMIWSADCEHCQEVTKQLYPYYTNSPIKNQFDVLAVSLDDTETEIPMWEKASASLSAWTHVRAKGGLLSPEAKAYFVVATPVMVLVDAKTNTIVAMPETARDVAGFFRE